MNKKQRLHTLTKRQAQTYFYYHIQEMQHAQVMLKINYKGNNYYTEWTAAKNILGNLDDYINLIKEEDLVNWKQTKEKPPVNWVIPVIILVAVASIAFFIYNTFLRPKGPSSLLRTQIAVLAPSDTPTMPPTVTPKPTPVVLWHALFSEGMPTDWTVITPEVKPSIVDGNFIAKDTFAFSVGDDSWKNYIVKVNFLDNPLCGGGPYSWVGVRARSLGKMMAFRLDCDGYVSLFIDNKDPIQGSRTKRIGAFEAKMEGDFYRYFDEDIYHEGYPNGYVIISIYGGVRVKEVEIVQLP